MPPPNIVYLNQRIQFRKQGFLGTPAIAVDQGLLARSDLLVTISLAGGPDQQQQRRQDRAADPAAASRMSGAGHDLGLDLEKRYELIINLMSGYTDWLDSGRQIMAAAEAMESQRAH